MKLRAAVLFVALVITAASCDRGGQGAAPVFHPRENPQYLSDWGMLATANGVLNLGDKVRPYDLATPLFSDYTAKLRTVWMPDGEHAQYRKAASFDFPVGAVLTKTFYYEHEGGEWTGAVLDRTTRQLEHGQMPLAGIRLIETRILVRREAGWQALAYVWNENQTDAVLKRIGDLKPMTLIRNDGRREEFFYVVPNVNQCAGCHGADATTKVIEPIGLKARHLNKPSSFAKGLNQLDHWLAAGLLNSDFTLDLESAAPRNAVHDDASASVDARARAYLDINCSHCHNPKGPADTSGLNLEPDAAGPALGKCKSPIAAGGGTGGRRFDIVPGAPDQSITVFRMETTDPGAMMPELGRAVTHEEGVALIAEWIAAMTGGCR